MAEELSTIYRKIAEKKAQQYEFLFSLESVFLSVMEFDPVTDEPLPVTVDDVLHKMALVDVSKDNFQNDRMNHIVLFVSFAVRNLIDILHEKAKLQPLQNFVKNSRRCLVLSFRPKLINQILLRTSVI